MFAVDVFRFQLARPLPKLFRLISLLSRPKISRREREKDFLSAEAPQVNVLNVNVRMALVSNF